MKVTIGKFQELYHIQSQDFENGDKAIMLIKSMLDINDEQIRKMPHLKLIKMCDDIRLLFEGIGDLNNIKEADNVLKIKGKSYILDNDILSMNAGRYIDVMTFADDFIGNLHLVLATMAKERIWLKAKYDVNKHQAIAEAMKSAPFEQGYSNAIILINSLKKINEEYEYLWLPNRFANGSKGLVAKDFSKNFGWIYNVKMVADMEGVSMDEVYNMPIRRFLNNLSYIKMYREMEGEELKLAEINRKMR